jgi:hypothetical protein
MTDNVNTQAGNGTNKPSCVAQQTFEKISEEQLDARYQFQPNHLNPNASWTYNDDPGCLFETFGEELEFVRGQNPRTIWTLVDSGDGDVYLESGYHHVNRIGYLLSTEPVPAGVQIQVLIPSHTDEDE